MLVTLKEMMDMAQKGGYAVPAFNVYNTETVMGVVEAAEEQKSPVIIQMYARLFKEGTAFYVSPSILAAANKVSVPVCFHLDHGPSDLEIARALSQGASGIMFDGSLYELEENISRTKAVVDYCAHTGVSVEGELGHIGSVNDDGMDEFTNVEEAARFVKETGVCALAVLIGNAHGRYKKTPKLDIQRVHDIYEATGHTPLVLHGGSGIPDDQVRAAVKAGIRKMNFGTDVCYSFLDKVFEADRSVYALDLFMKAPIAGVKAFAVSKMELLGSVNQAC